MGAGAYDMIENAHDGAAIANLAARFGLSEEQTVEAVRVLMPQLSRGLERNTLTRRDLADLLDALGSGGHERYADDPDLLNDPNVVEDGNAILGHILGSPAASRQIAAYGQQETGISAGILKQMLPYLASMLMGMLFKSGRGPLGDILGRLPEILGGGRMPQMPGEKDTQSLPWPLPRQPQTQPQPQPQPQPQDPGSPFPFPLPQSPQDAGQSFPSSRQGGPMVPGPDESMPRSPQFPQPQSTPPHAPGGNSLPDLSDILRGGGQNSGILAGIVRSIFGGMLGRGSGGGIIGWLFKLLILRFGWKIVTGLFRSILMRR